MIMNNSRVGSFSLFYCPTNMDGEETNSKVVKRICMVQL